MFQPGLSPARTALKWDGRQGPEYASTKPLIDPSPNFPNYCIVQYFSRVSSLGVDHLGQQVKTLVKELKVLVKIEILQKFRTARRKIQK